MSNYTQQSKMTSAHLLHEYINEKHELQRPNLFLNTTSKQFIQSFSVPG